MRRSLLVLLALALAVPALFAGCGGGEESQQETGGGQQATGGGGGKLAPIKLAFSTWNGYAGLVIGVEKGIFKDEGVEISYTVIEDPVQRFNALKAGKLDAVATTPDTFSRNYARGIETVQVLGLDASVGGDGIVAKKEITSVKQLKGQTVAVSEGSTSQWFLAYVLDQAGLSLDDVKQVNLTSGDAGAAFAAGRVPVAVTWEPWLTKAEKNPDGHVLVSTKKYPAIITDQVGFTPEFVNDHPETVQAFVRAYGKVMNYVNSNPDEAFGYAKEYLGQSVDEIKTVLETVPLWTLDDSRKYYGTSGNRGTIYDIFTESAEFWKSIGEIDSVPKPDDAIDPTFIDKALGAQ
ncbi:MAG: MetQ/NlpA family ABC transporter substrate-binding protein [Actinomycetota bacterium]|nr:MetQ/NlpA family ABC transporter substrate-binding protein [Actinomycetota bacterium]